MPQPADRVELSGGMTHMLGTSQTHRASVLYRDSQIRVAESVSTLACTDRFEVRRKHQLGEMYLLYADRSPYPDPPGPFGSDASPLPLIRLSRSLRNPAVLAQSK